MSKLTFVIREPGGVPERRIPVEAGLTIGRHPQCGCVLKDGTVSATHARVSDVNGSLMIEDLGGTNSIQANGQKMTKGETLALSDGLSMIFGQTEIDVLASEPAPAPAGTTQVDPDQTLVASAPPTADSDATIVGAADELDSDATMVGNVAPPQPAPAPAPPPPVAAPAPAPAPIPPTPAPAPPVVSSEEQVQAAPVPETGQVPLPNPADEGMGTLVYGGEELDPNDPNQIIALRASLSKLRPRLVFANEVDRRAFLIESPEISIGRGSDVECRVDHPAVSSRHARVTFEMASNRFFVEDLGGRNKTLLNGEQLAPNSKREILPESSIEFGPIQTLFVVNADSRNRPIPAERYEAALEVLTRDNKLQPHQRAQALGDTTLNERHVGESLLLTEVVTVEDWREAFREGEILIRTGMLKKQGDGKQLKLYVAIGAGVIVVILLLALLL